MITGIEDFAPAVVVLVLAAGNASEIRSPALAGAAVVFSSVAATFVPVGVAGSVPSGGGVWSDAQWRTTAPFKVPLAAGAGVVSVETSRDAIPGLTNYVIFRTPSGVLGPFIITGVPDGKHLIIQNPFGLTPGATLPSQSTVEVFSSWLLHENLVTLAPKIASLLSAGAAKIIWTNLEQITLLPVFRGVQHGVRIGERDRGEKANPTARQREFARIAREPRGFLGCNVEEHLVCGCRDDTHRTIAYAH